ncbi:MAG: hypothetical protein JW700_02955 [Candidatus Aenigmarchaeota archaeon]|nr:hypothetical protein [Candidatus Aenigmarchaeota archaeon]
MKNSFMSILVKENPELVEKIEKNIYDALNLEILGLVCQNYQGVEKERTVKIGDSYYSFFSKERNIDDSNVHKISKKLKINKKVLGNKIKNLEEACLIKQSAGKNGVFYIPTYIATELFD